MDTNDDMYGLETSSFNESTGQVTESQSIPVYAAVQTYPCSNCGRCFNTESLRKHQPICKKTTQKQPRKVFDTGKQRATDSDVPYKATRETTQFYQEGIKPKSDNPKSKTKNWRQDHNELVQTIRRARQITQAIETGAPLPKQLPAQVPSDYIQCEYCQRHFNRYTAERHIPFCETQFKRKQMHHAVTNHIRTPPINPRRHGQANQSEHQINSAPSKLMNRRPQKTNEGKGHQQSPVNSNLIKRPSFYEKIKDPSPKYGNHQMIKTRSARGSYLRGMMRTGRTTENDHLNAMADNERDYQINDPSLHHLSEYKTRPTGPPYRPTQVNGGYQQQDQQQQKSRVTTMAKHCHECGELFPVERAKFCCECGEKRFGVD